MRVFDVFQRLPNFPALRREIFCGDGRNCQHQRTFLVGNGDMWVQLARLIHKSLHIVEVRGLDAQGRARYIKKLAYAGPDGAYQPWPM